MSTTVEFFWDAASPYTYLAATQIAGLEQRTGISVVWRPFVLGKVFEATGNRMPAAVPAKAKHLFKDCQRWARFYEVPFAMPPVFPVHSILAGRLALAADAQGRGAAAALALMQATWGEGRDVARPEVASAALTAIGLNAVALLEATQSQVIKDQLKANTDEAIQRGAFGAPSFFVGPELFWGNDRLPLLAAHLDGRL